MKSVLVLGGGGNLGIAWECGVLAGLLEEGIDAREADAVIGTSAGSVVGTHVALGRDPRELVEQQRTREVRPLGDIVPDMNGVVETFTLWASFDEMTPENCAAVGKKALAAKTMPEEQWVGSFEANDWPGWPEKPLLLTAVACETGAFRAIDAAQGVAVARASAASCSVPGLFPPVAIDGERYTDGGVRSGTSADLALRFQPERVFIVAPMGTSERGVSQIVKRQLQREIAQLEAAGAKVTLVQPDAAALEIMGPNLMDPTKRVEAAAAGQVQGRALAPALRAFWK